MASSFPFRAIAPGDALPSLSFKNVKDNSIVATDSLKGGPVALVFWGADMDTKKERSLKTLAVVEETPPFLEQRKVKVLLINAQGDSQELMQGVVSQLSGKLPVYVDESQKAYNDLGIFVVPSVMLVDKDGKVVSGLGFSHDFSERLQGEVQVMLGEKSREAMEKGLRPEMKEKPAEEKQSHAAPGYGPGRWSSAARPIPQSANCRRPWRWNPRWPRPRDSSAVSTWTRGS